MSSTPEFSFKDLIHGLRYEMEQMDRLMDGFRRDLGKCEFLLENTSIPHIKAICSVKMMNLRHAMGVPLNKREELQQMYRNMINNTRASSIGRYEGMDVYEDGIFLDDVSIDRICSPIQNYGKFVIEEQLKIIHDKIDHYSTQNCIEQSSFIEADIDSIVSEFNDFIQKQLQSYMESKVLSVFKHLHDRMKYLESHPAEDKNSMDMTDFNKVACKIDEMDTSSVIAKRIALQEAIEYMVGTSSPLPSMDDENKICKRPELVSENDLEYSNIKQLVHKKYVYDTYPAESFELSINRIMLDEFRKNHPEKVVRKYINEESPRIKELRELYKIDGEIKVPHPDILLHDRINTQVFFDKLDLKDVEQQIIDQMNKRKRKCKCDECIRAHASKQQKE